MVRIIIFWDILDPHGGFLQGLYRRYIGFRWGVY